MLLHVRKYNNKIPNSVQHWNRLKVVCFHLKFIFCTYVNIQCVPKTVFLRTVVFFTPVYFFQICLHSILISVVYRIHTRIFVWLFLLEYLIQFLFGYLLFSQWCFHSTNTFFILSPDYSNTYLLRGFHHNPCEILNVNKYITSRAQIKMINLVHSVFSYADLIGSH